MKSACAWAFSGTVANQPDGSVHIIAMGTKEAVDALIQWCRQGPPKATVSSVETEERAPEAFDGFKIEREA